MSSSFQHFFCFLLYCFAHHKCKHLKVLFYWDRHVEIATSTQLHCLLLYAMYFVLSSMYLHGYLAQTVGITSWFLSPDCVSSFLFLFKIQSDSQTHCITSADFFMWYLAPWNSVAIKSLDSAGSLSMRSDNSL